MRQTLEEANLYNEESYLIMMYYCDTIDSLGLAPYGFESLAFIHAAPGHFTSACFKFYTLEDKAFFGSPYISSTTS